MKYQKGTFIVVPNKESLRGKPSELQAIYFWLCEHADDTGKSFPTKNTLADEAGCSHNTLDKYLTMLIDSGMIEMTQRKKKGTNENTSNLYQVNLVPKMRRPTTKINTTCPPNNGSETNLSINKPHLTTNIQPTVEFSFEEEMKKLSESNYKPHKIIHLFIVRKKWKFDNKQQWKVIMGRLIKPAIALSGYTGKDIDETILYCDREYGDKLNWGLETVLKIIPNIANKK